MINLYQTMYAKDHLHNTQRLIEWHYCLTFSILVLQISKTNCKTYKKHFLFVANNMGNAATAKKGDSENAGEQNQMKKKFEEQ